MVIAWSRRNSMIRHHIATWHAGPQKTPIMTAVSQLTSNSGRRWSEYRSQTFADSKCHIRTLQATPHSLLQSLDPKSMVLKPYFGTEGFPPLPPIRDQVIREQVFTHRSFYARPTHIFEDLPDDPSPDNEMYEHLGDSVLGMVVTELVGQTYKYLRVGPATKIRALVVGNSTLADISKEYGLFPQLRLHSAQAMALQASVNIQANIFEAYIGGLYKDQGLPVVQTWLYALLRPYISEAYRIIRIEYRLPTDPPAVPPSPPGPPRPPPTNTWVPSSTASVGHLALFNQHLQQQRQIVEWQYTSERGEGTKTTPVWAVRAILDDKCISSGRGNTKKIAKNEAAKEGLEKMGILVML